MNIDSKLTLSKGDYFFPYDRNFTSEAQLVTTIGRGGTGTVIQVCIPFYSLPITYTTDASSGPSKISARLISISGV
jgi:hypothetical protein